KIDKKKLSIVDILCKDEKGASYIIEMQVSENRGFEKRVQYYTSKVYSDQAMVGEKYHNLKRVIFIAISDYIIFSEPEDADYKSEHAILNQKTKKQSLKDLCFVFIELPKFHKTKEELSSIEEKWCYFFKHAHETIIEDLEKETGKDHIINKAYTALNQYYWTKKELMSYDKKKRARMDHKAILQYKLDEGEAKGLKKGIQQGLEQGIEKGKNRGQARRQNRG
ncbi:MAG: Rpn family recombination-promoting nuclease/putative transposase, partial [Candidatus Rhabdochlamydia sp.]